MGRLSQTFVEAGPWRCRGAWGFMTSGRAACPQPGLLEFRTVGERSSVVPNRQGCDTRRDDRVMACLARELLVRNRKPPPCGVSRKRAKGTRTRRHLAYEAGPALPESARLYREPCSGSPRCAYPASPSAAACGHRGRRRPAASTTRPEPALCCPVCSSAACPACQAGPRMSLTEARSTCRGRSTRGCGIPCTRR